MPDPGAADAEEAAANDVEALAVALMARRDDRAFHVVGDVRRALCAWATRREMASHDTEAGGL